MWLQQMAGGAGGLAAREAAEQLQEDRAIRDATDREFEESLAADRRRQSDCDAVAEQSRAAEARRLSQLELRAALRAALPAEPPAGEEGDIVRVRVRLPAGGAAERRWAAGAAVGDLQDWVQGLEGLPLSWEPGTWCLATGFPTAPLRDRDQGLGELAAGTRALALFVTQL